MSSTRALLGKASSSWGHFRMGTKVKIVSGFYMIASNAPSVYEMSTLPSSVQTLLAAFDSIISLGLPLATKPLACMGASSFESRLLFFFVAPLVFLAVFVLGEFVHTALHERHVDKVPHKANSKDPKADLRHQPTGNVRAPLSLLLRRAAIAALPVAFRFLFLAYPSITKIAFQAFPCHDFGDEGRWLIADVSVRCDSGEHSQIVQLATFTVVRFSLARIDPAHI